MTMTPPTPPPIAALGRSRPSGSSPSPRIADKVGFVFTTTFTTTILEESMRMVAAIGAAQVLSVLAFFGAGTADAAEIKMLVSNAMKTTMEELAPQFEKASEHKLAITFGAASELKTSIENGAAFDVAILTPAVIEALVKEG